MFGVLAGRVRAFRRQRGNRVGHGLFSTEKQHLGSSPPYGCVFFLSNNASNRQVSHSKEGRTSQARYTFINLGNLRPSLFSLTHTFPSVFASFASFQLTHILTMATTLPTTNGKHDGANGTDGVASFAVKAGLARMLKGGVIMDVVNAEQVRSCSMSPRRQCH